MQAQRPELAKIIGVAAKDNKEHELYGVNDPDKAEVGTKGVGTLVAMQDGKGNDLLRMIVGKTAGLNDDGAQLGDARATGVVEVYERKAGPGHRILQGTVSPT